MERQSYGRGATEDTLRLKRIPTTPENHRRNITSVPLTDAGALKKRELDAMRQVAMNHRGRGPVDRYRQRPADAASGTTSQYPKRQPRQKATASATALATETKPKLKRKQADREDEDTDGGDALSRKDDRSNESTPSKKPSAYYTGHRWFRAHDTGRSDPRSR
ncbi:MAG: hypothetical protein LQ337_004416 [Flavoplaca oasis]|nr:MAG: hypothetical protein LQ337_004416 [Flavoplaca oasis]